MTKGLVFDIKRYAIHDGPGIRTTVFLKGCPMNCLWCDNPESQRPSKEFIFWQERCIRCSSCIYACEKNAIIKKNDGLKEIDEGKCGFCEACAQACYSEALQIVGRYMAPEEALEEICKDADFYMESGGGVTFSGGEAFSQPDFLYEVLVACKERNFHTAVDTCGFVPWDILEKASPYVDLFLYDLKVMEDTRHRRFTGVSNSLILENLVRLAKVHRIIVRVPLIPNINDDDENIKRMGDFLLGLKRIEGIDILPYHKLGFSKYGKLRRPYTMRDVPSPMPEKVNEIRRVLERLGFRLNVGG